ncbi:MAG: LacI family DNA-binding transcriptional regulator [Spirochaetes bacterium]|nr:LacI family DNA-binding transcriptional regulator [Spirochaetota bacterium]
MARKHISIDTIARLSGYSRATVSRVIGSYGYVSEKARNRIEAVIKKYNYHPSGVARSMVSGKTHTIGLIQTDIRNAFCNITAKAIEDVIVGHGYNLIICNSGESLKKERQSLDLLLGKQVDGLVVSPTVDMDGKFGSIFDEIRRYNLPTVCIDRPIPPRFGIPVVTVDNHQGGYRAAKYLLSLGHSRIAVVTTRLPLPNVRERENGFYDALEEQGIRRMEEDRIEIPPIQSGREAEGGETPFEGWGRFTAVFATANIFSIYAMRWMKKCGYSIPKDLSLVGFDDLLYWEFMSPQLTVIVQPIARIGELAAEMLLHAIEGRGPKGFERIVLPVTMEERSSTKSLCTADG